MTEAKQGHRYAWNNLEVIAMENGPYPEVHALTGQYGWPLRYIGRVDATALKPLPMVYFGNEVPA